MFFLNGSTNGTIQVAVSIEHAVLSDSVEHFTRVFGRQECSGGILHVNHQQRSTTFGLTTLICVVIASMIGSGVFTTSGFSIASLGSPVRVLTAWLIGGGIAVCGAVSYGVLARLMPQSGGEYLYLSRQLHPAAGFIAGWVSLTAGFTSAIALTAMTFETYAIPNRPDWLPENVAAIGLILAFGVGHSWFVEMTTRFQNAVVILKVGALILFLGYVVIVIRSHQWHWASLPDAPVNWGKIAAEMSKAVMWISLSYAGFNAAIYVGSEVPNGERVIPNALLMGTLIVTVLYLALNTVFVAAAPASEIAGQPDVAAIAARAVGGVSLERLIRGTIAVATLTSVAGMVMTGPRVYAQMANDGVFPSFFAAEKGVMHRSILMQAFLAAGVVLVSDLHQLLNYMGTTLSISSALAVSTLIPFGSDLFVRAGIRPGLQPVIRTAAACYVGATTLAVVLMLSEDSANIQGAFWTMFSGLLLWIAIRRIGQFRR